MTFFNQKEEVIEIELTQYGKHLLSTGKLKPAYYAFFDDDIIYDAKYTGVQENNGTAVERIKTTPRTKTQYVFTGLEEEVKKNLQLIKQGKQNLNSLNLISKSDKHYVLNKKIGTSYLGDNKLPSLNLTVLNGEIQSTTLLQSGSLDDMPLIKTPLLQLKDLNYVLSKERIGNDLTQAQDMIYLSSYTDGSAVALTENYLLVDAFENNVENEMKNFDIEMFLCEIDPETGEEELTPLHFDQKYEDYKNGILLDPKKDDIETENFLIEQKNNDRYRAENYFNITIDQQIEKNLICKLINKMKQNNNLYDPLYDCEDYQEQETTGFASQDLYDPSYNEDDVNKC